ncbi:related to multidrug resistant protein [Serendipita indica DSM 11827]|uniref:Related to multidrug resistant protein n=1 Tax=Serendipita indica (strain DSM 11827) TaxID=1109443 RepID=G4U0H5_SERID|nr:related to multidrug resistant protein [Serendipita indica DSM 11827]
MRQGVDTFIVRIMSSSQYGHPTLSTGDRTENATLNGDISISEKNKEIKAKNERFDGRDLEAATTGVVAVDDTAPGGMSEMERKQIEAGNPNIVDWEPNDPGYERSIFRTGTEPKNFSVFRNPLNWSSSRKWFNMGTVGLMCFVSPFASTLPAPALPTIAHNFRITNSSVAALCISIFILAYAFGPLVASPASELYGRAPVYKAFFVIFFLFNIGSALAKNTTQFILCRFFAGIGGSATITVAAGSRQVHEQEPEKTQLIWVQCRLVSLGAARGSNVYRKLGTTSCAHHRPSDWWLHG